MISSPWLAEMNIGQGLLHIKILLKNGESVAQTFRFGWLQLGRIVWSWSEANATLCHSPSD